MHCEVPNTDCFLEGNTIEKCIQTIPVALKSKCVLYKNTKRSTLSKYLRFFFP